MLMEAVAAWSADRAQWYKSGTEETEKQLEAFILGGAIELVDPIHHRRHAKATGQLW